HCKNEKMMERNLKSKFETEQTARLRSKFDQERKFLSRFYKNNWVRVPTKTGLLLNIIVLFVALLIVVFYGNLNGLLIFLIACSVLTSLFRITCYIKSKMV
ncbi:MAG TPA: hypothetical protein VLR49_14280, partial [Ferruginibacter sp.]|nr:hypothetical protein [Ferruginibacter sp.]